MEAERSGWVCGVAESAWHRMAGYQRQPGFSAPIAGCGHVVIGPVHRRLVNPPRSGGRRICSGCLPLEVLSVVTPSASPVTITGRFAVFAEVETGRSARAVALIRTVAA